MSWEHSSQKLGPKAFPWSCSRPSLKEKRNRRFLRFFPPPLGGRAHNVDHASRALSSLSIATFIALLTRLLSARLMEDASKPNFCKEVWFCGGVTTYPEPPKFGLPKIISFRRHSKTQVPFGRTKVQFHMRKMLVLIWSTIQPIKLWLS